MAEDDSEQYAQQLAEFLGAINPELFEIEGVLQRCAEGIGMEPFPTNEEVEDLIGVELALEHFEDAFTHITTAVLPEYSPPIKPTLPESTEAEGDKFEVLLAKFLPKFQASLAMLSEELEHLNVEVANIELEVLESPPQDANMKDNFLDNIRRFRQNLCAIEQFLIAPEEIEEEIVEPQIERLYKAPPWSTSPTIPYYFEVREGESVVDKIAVNVKGSYLIGRLPICDIVADDATCSRQHAIVQFRPGDPDPISDKRTDEVYIYDLGSTSGTYVNGMPLQAKAYYPLYKGDILQFGQYSCAFVLRDCSEAGIEPPESLKQLAAEVHQMPVEQTTTTTDENGHILPAGDGPQKELVSLEFLSKPLDPRSKDFNKDAYKQAMIEKYLQQQKENEELLRKRREREAQGLPPPNDIPYVPERPSKKKKKSKKDKDDCVVC